MKNDINGKYRYDPHPVNQNIMNARIRPETDHRYGEVQWSRVKNDHEKWKYMEYSNVSSLVVVIQF